MLQIILCEDDHKQRARLENIIEHYLIKENRDMTIALSVSTPQEVLDYLRRVPDQKGLYFLDIDLQQDISGVDLAVRIREHDPGAKIVFITTHDKMTRLVFQYKIEALDFIVKDKDDIPERMKECLDVALSRFESQLISPEEEYYAISTGKHATKIPISEILFFETNLAAHHRIILHTKDGCIDFLGTIKEIVTAHEDFFLCHRSFVVNVKNIKSVDKTQNVAVMTNGETAPVSTRKMATLLGLMEV